MTVKTFRGFAIALFGAVALAGPAFAANEQSTLAIPGVNVLFLVQYVAADLHLWEKRGLDVKVLNITGIGSMNAVISGSADFSMSSGASIARAAARGQKLVALATAITQSGQSVVVRKDVADAAHFDPNAPLSVRGAILKGRTWAHGGTGAIPDVVLKVVGKDAGVLPDQMVATPMQPPEFMAAFANHSIDGFSNSPPFVEQVLLDGTGVLVSDSRLGEPTEFSPVSAALLLTRNDFCAKSRSVCEKMVGGVVDALKVIHDDRDQAISIMKAHFGTYNDKVLAAAYDTVKAMTPIPPVTTPKMIENGDSMNVAAGFLKPEEKLPRYDDLIDNSFAEAAVK
jgi:ABC-type nitrate/sulfonate/bicarbonate transport system substrate-binding protein